MVKKCLFVHFQGLKTVYAMGGGGGGGGQKWQNSVHVVVECPLTLTYNHSMISHRK